jgi:hypothetical protein
LLGASKLVENGAGSVGQPVIERASSSLPAEAAAALSTKRARADRNHLNGRKGIPVFECPQLFGFGQLNSLTWAMSATH